MSRVVWTAESVDNLERLGGRAARPAPASSLDANPERGRPIARGLRELAVIHPYLIRYRITEDGVIILRIRHGMRQPD